MLRVEGMPVAEMHALLHTTSFGHLGCAQNGRPYVVPMHYAYDGKELYFFTTEGMKTQFMNGNPQVCLQVRGDYRHLALAQRHGDRSCRKIDKPRRDRATMKQIVERNPSLTQAISAAQQDAGDNLVNIAFYRIQPEVMDARKNHVTVSL